MINKTPKSLINTDFSGIDFICYVTVMDLIWTYISSSSRENVG